MSIPAMGHHNADCKVAVRFLFSPQVIVVNSKDQFSQTGEVHDIAADYLGSRCMGLGLAAEDCARVFKYMNVERLRSDMVYW